jgi:hypothetical protein
MNMMASMADRRTETKMVTRGRRGIERRRRRMVVRWI